MQATIQWEKRDLPTGEAVAAFAEQSGLPIDVARIVWDRTGSLEAAHAFLSPKSQPPSDPFAIPEMDAAIARIRRAVRNREPITVFGDYDADGITGTVLLVRALQRLGATVKPFFPSREREGYGLTPESVSRCMTFKPKPSLLITVDCGITSVAEVAWLKEQGVEVIVTDHHALPDELPAALARVNPRRLPEGSPAAGLCGCATAYMVVRALELRGEAVRADDYLDLVAVATISDVMELIAENRMLVARGLETIAAKVVDRDRPGNDGLAELVACLNIRANDVCAEKVAFSISPCINAASRMGEEEFKKAYGLLGLEKCQFAKCLIEINEQRKACERNLFDRIKETFKDKFCVGKPLAVGGEEYHAGVIGIVSARLMEELHAPVAVINKSPDGSGHGSMRTCGAHDAVEALRKLDDLLDHFGGHAKAAGFALKPGCFDAFCERFPEAFPEEETPKTVNVYDADLSQCMIDLDYCRAVERLEPFGNANPKPVFSGKFLVRAVKLITNGAHALLELEPAEQPESRDLIKAIWFRGGPDASLLALGECVRCWFNLTIDRYNPAKEAPKLQIIDLRIDA